MILIFAEIDLINGGDLILHRRGYLDETKVKRMRVDAVVNSNSYKLTINDDVKNQLDLPLIEKQFVTLADETQLEVEIVGPVEIRFENRRTSCDAVVLPSADDVLLGSIPMKDMDVLVHPREEKLVVNPKHPYIANKYLK